MRKILLIALSMLLTVTVFGQYRITDKSAKRVPKWVNAIEQDYLIVTATAPNQEAAKAAVLSSLKSQIAEAVASRVVAETNLKRSDSDINGSTNYAQELTTSISSQTAKLPFMSEVSLSKASEYYWETRYYKKSKVKEVFYAVKYPFSDFEMKKLVLAFQKHDKELDEQLAEFEVRIEQNDITSIEDIDKAIVDLKAFKDEFLQTDPRYSKIMSLTNQYLKIYGYIEIDAYQAKKGVIVSVLKLSDKQIGTRQKPLIKSNCAGKITQRFEGNALTIEYDDFGCYDEDENYIEIRYRTGNKFLSKKVYIKL